MPIYTITPVPKPRMTQRDKWLSPPRKCVAEYRAFKDEVGLRRVILPLQGAHITFILPMPPSWSKKKRAEMDGRPHQQTPDVDNLLKALADACYANDAKMWDIRVTKLWGQEGAIRVEAMADYNLMGREGVVVFDNIKLCAGPSFF